MALADIDAVDVQVISVIPDIAVREMMPCRDYGTYAEMRMVAQTGHLVGHRVLRKGREPMGAEPPAEPSSPVQIH